MKATLLTVFVAIAQLNAENPKQLLTRIECRYISPEIQPESFAAKPKIFYIGGTTYFRAEEQPDPPLGIHGLIVITEPDIWIVNLITHTAQHSIDPGPTFNIHHPIFDHNAPKEFSTLEFGRESEFFSSHHATSLPPRSLEGQRCEASEFTYADYRIVLYTRVETQKPFHLDVFRDDKPYFSYRYLSYETDLPFDANLFRPPNGIRIVEAKPSNSK